MRLAHGWMLEAAPAFAVVVRGFIRPAVRAVPDGMARRIGHCRVAMVADLPDGVAGQRGRVGDVGLAQLDQTDEGL